MDIKRADYFEYERDNDFSIWRVLGLSGKSIVLAPAAHSDGDAMILDSNNIDENWKYVSYKEIQNNRISTITKPILLGLGLTIGASLSSSEIMLSLGAALIIAAILFHAPRIVGLYVDWKLQKYGVMQDYDIIKVKKLNINFD